MAKHRANKARKEASSDEEPAKQPIPTPINKKITIQSEKSDSDDSVNSFLNQLEEKSAEQQKEDQEEQSELEQKKKPETLQGVKEKSEFVFPPNIESENSVQKENITEQSQHIKITEQSEHKEHTFSAIKKPSPYKKQKSQLSDHEQAPAKKITSKTQVNTPHLSEHINLVQHSSTNKPELKDSSEVDKYSISNISPSRLSPNDTSMSPYKRKRLNTLAVSNNKHQRKELGNKAGQLRKVETDDFAGKHTTNLANSYVRTKF